MALFLTFIIPAFCVIRVLCKTSTERTLITQIELIFADFFDFVSVLRAKAVFFRTRDRRL